MTPQPHHCSCRASPSGPARFALTCLLGLSCLASPRLTRGEPAQVPEGAPAQHPPEATRKAPSGATAQIPKGSPAPDAVSPEASKPLDVRRGEPYDGRPPAPDRLLAARAVPRIALFLPRLATDLLLRFSVALSDYLERTGALAWTRRLLWAWDGRLRVLPLGGWRTDLTPTGGALLATDLLFGKARRAGLVATGYAGGSQVFGASLAVEFLGLDLTGRPRAPGRLRLTARGGFDRRADLPFYGLGSMASLAGEQAERALLGRDLAWADLGLQVGLWRSLSFGLRAGFDWRRLFDGLADSGTGAPLSRIYGTDFVAYEEAVAAFLGALSLSAGGPLGELLPEPGWRARAEATLLAGAEQHSRLLRLDARLEIFASLGQGGGQRLGLRGRVTGLGGLGHEAIPLPYLPSLGGLSALRGFSAGRFRGESLAWLALEHYAALHPRLWLCLFLEWGAAWRERFTGGAPKAGSNLDGGGWLGLRVAPGFWLQLQAAGSREGPRLFVGVRTSP